MDGRIIDAANMKTAEKQYVAEDTPIKDCLSG
jgi:hypothetical protein